MISGRLISKKLVILHEDRWLSKEMGEFSPCVLGALGNQWMDRQIAEHAMSEGKTPSAPLAWVGVRVVHPSAVRPSVLKGPRVDPPL